MTDTQFAALLDEYWIAGLDTEERIVVADVVAIEKNWVIVDAHLKSQFSIAKQEFLDARGELTVAVGEQVKVFVESADDGFGETRLSRDKAKQQETWDQLHKAMETQENMEGKVLYKIKGGYHVDVNGLRAFLPGSLADIRPAREIDDLEGQTIEFKVLKIDRAKNNVLISRKAVFARELAEQREKLLETIKEGAILKGKVKNMVNYGAFVGLEGIDGLLHVTDMSWRRIKRPEEVVSIGEEVEVKVLKFDHENQRVSLGMKQLAEDPWVSLQGNFATGDKVKATVTNIIQYGCFAEITDGVEGLVHLSEMSWSNKNVKPSKVVEVGQEVEVMILDLDIEQRRLSLGMRQCMPNPWETFASTYKPGDKLSGTVNTITDFGLFVSLGDDGHTDGLVHASDLDWNMPGKDALRQYKKGDEVDVVVMVIDVEKERVSLGIKQLTEDPFVAFCKDFAIDSEITAPIKTINSNRVQLAIGDFPLYIRINNRNQSMVSGKQIDDELTVTIVAFDDKNRCIRADFNVPEEPNIETLQPEKTDTIGDLIKQQQLVSAQPTEETAVNQEEWPTEKEDK